MPDGTFAVEVATPERQLLAGRARAVVARSSEGDFTVLAGHAPLVADVVPGALRVDQPEGSALFCVHGGYLQVDRTSPEEAADLGTAGETRVTVLGAVAERAEEIDVERAERARDAAQSALAELGASPGPGPRTGGGGEGEADEEAGSAVRAAERERRRLEAALARAETRLAVAAGARARP